MSEPIYAGLTSQSIDVMLRDSTSTTGAGLAGLVYNTSGLKAYYRKGATGTPTAITLATQTVGGAWSSGGFVEVDSTNMIGVYRLDLPNAAVDTEGFVTLYIFGAANLVPMALRIDCRALPVDVKKFGGTAGTFSSGRPEVNATHVAGTSQTAGDLAAMITVVDDYVDSEVAAIKAKTDNLPSDPADASDISSAFSAVNSTLATIAAYIDQEVAAIKAKTDNLPESPAATGDAMTLTSAYDFAKGTVAPTESYRSANGVPTPIQALLEIIAHLGESSISSTTKTLKKVDGSTTAKTFTLNDATTPTSITETT